MGGINQGFAAAAAANDTTGFRPLTDVVWGTITNSSSPWFLGGNWTGTLAARNIATTNSFTQRRRATLATAATASAINQYRATVGEVYRGDADNKGGFGLKMRMGVSHAAAVADARAFVGLMAPVAISAPGIPQSLVNAIGLQFEGGETTWRIGSNDATGNATRVDLGADFPCNTLSLDAIELELSAEPFASSVSYIVRNLTSGISASGTLSTDLPLPTVLMGPMFFIGNGTTALAASLDLMGIHLRHRTGF
jgi:hypothetical protein